MKFEHIVILAIFLIIFLFMSLPAIYIAFIMRGVGNEGRISLYNSFFPEIVHRATLIEQYGDLSISYSRMVAWPVLERPAAVQRNMEVLDAAFGHGQDLGCINLEAMATDPESVRARFWGDVRLRPFRYVIFSIGDAPDISPFFDESANAPLIGGILFQGQTEPEYNDNEYLLNGIDISDRYERVMRAHPQGISWNSVLCGGYSYIEFFESP